MFDVCFSDGSAVSPRMSNPIHWLSSLGENQLFSYETETTRKCLNFDPVNILFATIFMVVGGFIAMELGSEFSHLI